MGIAWGLPAILVLAGVAFWLGWRSGRAYERSRGLIEQLGEGLATLDREGRFSYCNQRFAEMVGYSVDELDGLRLLDMVETPSKDAIHLRLADRRDGSRDHYELLLRRKDGATLDTLISVTRLVDGHGAFDGLLTLFTDITERKSSEEATLRAAKSESLSLMASGIAHDFNNLFQSIQGNLEMAMANPGDRIKLNNSLQRALRILGDAASLSRKMLDYSGRGFRRAISVDLHDLVTSRLEQLKLFIHPGIDLRVGLADNLPSVKGDPDQILQIISGLVANGSEAIEGSGVIELALAREYLEESDVRGKYWAEPPPSQEVISLSVKDTGKGIPAEHLSRIFDPFFTTKTAGRGLGLSATLGIIRNHRAGLHVISSPEGTTFRLCFEPVGVEETCDLPVPRDATPIARTILLVDDDLDLQEVIAEGLHDILGCEVLLARDGAEAVEIYHENANRIDLILMDAVMPRLSGGTAFDIIKRTHPDAKAILCSGYGDEIGIEVVGRHGFRGFLKKPFSIKELHEAMEKALGRS